MLKIYLQLRSTLIKFLNIKLIIVLKMKTKNLMLIGKPHDDFLQVFIARYASLE